LSGLIKLQLQTYPIKPRLTEFSHKQVPIIISEIFERLEVCLKGTFIPNLKISNSFYNLNDSMIYSDQWGNNQEDKLKELKSVYNNIGFLNFSQIKDIRIVVQLLFDFLFSLKSPAISESTIEYLISLFQTHSKSEVIDTLDQIESKNKEKFNKKVNQFVYS
jgi:hypothetical protein